MPSGIHLGHIDMSMLRKAPSSTRRMPCIITVISQEPGGRLFEDAIASPVDIPSSIARCQKTLGYASTPLDFVCGIGLYLMPSGMALHPGNVQGYNNEIQIAGSDAAIKHNPGINEAEPITSKGDKAFQGKTSSPAGTIHKGPQPSQFHRNKTNDDGTSAADPPE